MAGRIKDETGNVYDRLAVVKYVGKDKRNQALWFCNCSCGRNCTVTGASLRKGKSKSCGCKHKEYIHSAKKLINLTGMRFGNLLVTSLSSTAKRGARWRCNCDCGSAVVIPSRNLLAGITKSCGCYNKKRTREALLVDVAGQRFGMLVVQRLAELGSRQTRWICQCDCGNMTTKSLDDLRRRKSWSCGCRNRLAYGEAAFRAMLTSKKAGASARGYKWEISDDEVRLISKMNCVYCGRPPFHVSRPVHSNGEYVYGGFDRINNKLGYVEGNVVSCCRECNMAKSAKTIDEFYQWVMLVHENSSQWYSALANNHKE